MRAGVLSMRERFTAEDRGGDGCQLSPFGPSAAARTLVPMADSHCKCLFWSFLCVLWV